MIRQTERFDLKTWEEDIEAIFGRTHKLLTNGSKKFHGISRREYFGNIMILKMFTETPISIESGFAGKSSEKNYHVFFIENGEMIDSFGNLVPSRKMLIVDGQRSYRASQSSMFHTLGMTIPAKILGDRIADINEYCNFTKSSLLSVDKLIYGYMNSLLEQASSLPSTLRSLAGEHLLELLRASISEQTQSNDEERLLLQYISAHLADPTLSPQRAAQAFGVSVRTVHTWMARLGTSFTREVRKQRLQRCREDLEIIGSTLSITEVAYRWGFSSLGNFGQLFRNEFGISPREWRKNVYNINKY